MAIDLTNTIGLQVNQYARPLGAMPPTSNEVTLKEFGYYGYKIEFENPDTTRAIIYKSTNGDYSILSNSSWKFTDYYTTSESTHTQKIGGLFDNTGDFVPNALYTTEPIGVIGDQFLHEHKNEWYTNDTAISFRSLGSENLIPMKRQGSVYNIPINSFINPAQTVYSAYSFYASNVIRQYSTIVNKIEAYPYFNEEESFTSFIARISSLQSELTNPFETIDLYNAMAFFNIYITENQSHAEDYIANGTVYDDFKIFEIPTPPPPPDPDDESIRDVDQSAPQTPDKSAIELTNENVYYATKSEIDGVLQWFANVDYQTILENLISGKYNNLSSCIVSISDMPLSDTFVGSVSDVHVVVGGVDTNVSSKQFTDSPPLVHLGSIFVEPKFKSFLDFQASLKLYLPFYSFIDLDINVYMGRWLIVDGVFDVLTGKLTYFVGVADSDTQGFTTTHTIECKISTEFSLTLDNETAYKSEQIASLTQKATSLVGSVVGVKSGDVFNSISSGLNSILTPVNPPHLDMVGGASDSAGLYSPQKLYLMMSFPTVQYNDEYGASVGYPCGKAYKLSDLNGYTQCVNARINNWTNSPTDNEINEIYNILNGGVIL